MLGVEISRALALPVSLLFLGTDSCRQGPWFFCLETAEPLFGPLVLLCVITGWRSPSQPWIHCMHLKAATAPPSALITCM